MVSPVGKFTSSWACLWPHSRGRRPRPLLIALLPALQCTCSFPSALLIPAHAPCICLFSNAAHAALSCTLCYPPAGPPTQAAHPQTSPQAWRAWVLAPSLFQRLARMNWETISSSC